MKIKHFALIGVTALLLTGCSSSSTEADAEKLYKNKDVSGYVATVDENKSKELEEVDSKDKKIGKDGAESAAFLVQYGILKAKTSLVAPWTYLTVNFAVRNALDKELAKAYKDDITYTISGATTTVQFEGASDLDLGDDIKNCSFAYSYEAVYNSNGLLTKANLIASYVQQEKGKEPTVVRTYKSYRVVSWSK